MLNQTLELIILYIQYFRTKGEWQDSSIVMEGSFLNSEIVSGIIKPGKNTELPETSNFLKISNNNVVVSTFKPSESGNGMVLRLYNCHSATSRVKVELGFEVDKVQEIDLIENKTYGDILDDKSYFDIELGRYEIKTLKLYNSRIKV